MTTLEQRPFGVCQVKSTLYYGWDAIESLKAIGDGSVHAVVTSPPYWMLRDYKVDGQLGLEKTAEEYVSRLVGIFGEIRRVLRDDGIVWLNIGDNYVNDLRVNVPLLKIKDLVGIPWMVAFALRQDGWYLRSEVIWYKENCMPESVHTRPTRAHEHIFLLTKKPKYFYDDIAIKEPADYQASGNVHRLLANGTDEGRLNTHLGFNVPWEDDGLGRNKRSVWIVNTRPYAGAHFAVFPPDLIDPCIKSGTSEKGCCPACGAPWVREVERREDVEALDVSTGGYPERQDGGTRERAEAGSGGGTRLATRRVFTGLWKQGCKCPAQEPVPCTVLDMFSGVGTTGYVANRLGRDFIGLDINADYIDLAQARILGLDPPTEDEKSQYMTVFDLLGE